MVVYGYARLVRYDETYHLGPDILEKFEVEEGRIFLDDPAHQPVPGRHVHRRSVLPDAAPGDHQD